eukprot:TRINITY_DN6293_c0_g1_i1.p1 TRINITY_DN6293_c0_g1~~TRINITY_DN6293_c0_g1_i1.p1  ORF type:complete len:288 (-),score=53.59 TRINITY_DN6293_c0_g1_i1:110-973(-)
MKSILIVLSVACILASSAEAWGPISHLYFASSAFPSSDGTLSPSKFSQACDMPDSFYFVNWSEYPNCSIPVDDMHNPITAGYIVQFALTNEGQQFRSATFDPLSFALGYGSHMASDVVGFHANGGYLGSSVPSYVTEFQFMSAIDSYFLTKFSFSGAQWATDEASNFMAAASVYINKQNPSFAVFNVDQVNACVMPWKGTIESLVKMSTMQAQSGYYKNALVFFDQFNATTWEQAESHLNLSLGCAVPTIQFWASQLLDSKATPQQATQNTIAYVNNLFKVGKCTPQ